MGEALLADGAAATSSTKPASWVEAEGVDAAGLFSSQGYLWVRGVLPQSLAAAAAKEIDEMLEDALAKVEETPEVEESHFGNVRSRGSRHDFKVRLVGSAREAVVSALRVLLPMLSELLTAEARLCELSCLVSDPGAQRQALHYDTRATEVAGLVTIFLALQPVSEDMGPTLVLPATHTPDVHAALQWKDGQLSSVPTGREEVCFTADVGDALVMDSRVLHCGGANVSKERRRLLYVTLQVPHNAPRGSTYSLLDDYRGRFSLASLEDWRDQRHT
eukprot:TRINITY_DN18834_c0_g1_i2.p1 TRINITY_DN18834_c0_g1~~TRINITY_DN18834_c0_g1_i2.p1  ORF type:complete len:275 (-),score=50.51 TRINITY_DN18834_c0_g1_i2:150-974(-)